MEPDRMLTPYAFALWHMRNFQRKYPTMRFTTYEGYRQGLEEIAYAWVPETVPCTGMWPRSGTFSNVVQSDSRP